MNKRFRILWFAALFVVASCDRDDPAPANPNERINTWIYDNMKTWYYWTDEIPTDPNKTLEHKAFFESLLSDKDRFSWIEENYQELLNSLQGVSKESGY